MASHIAKRLCNYLKDLGSQTVTYVNVLRTVHINPDPGTVRKTFGKPLQRFVKSCPPVGPCREAVDIASQVIDALVCHVAKLIAPLFKFAGGRCSVADELRE